MNAPKLKVSGDDHRIVITAYDEDGGTAEITVQAFAALALSRALIHAAEYLLSRETDGDDEPMPPLIPPHAWGRRNSA